MRPRAILLFKTMKKLLSLLLFAAGTSAVAQDTLRQKNLDEVIIYSNKFEERKKNIVQKVEVISAQRIAQLNSQNTGDLLMNTGNVFVQKSQQGGSSPVIRGFEASRVLIVVDGIRLNNAIYRAGHLQNVITVDQNMLERVEVLYGPASTIYGSDALGGVIHLRTKQPRLSPNGKLLASGSAFARYSSANNERTGHFDLSLGGKKIAWLQSYNYSDFDDLRMGDSYRSKYPNFGRRTQYVTRINGIDSVVTNPDDRIQKFSGYSQWDITQKLLYKQSDKVSHSLNLQYSNSTNVPRYDRLQDISNGTLRYAEWYYGPQERRLAAYEMNVVKVGPLNNLRALISYQHLRESRHQREYRRYQRLDNRVEKVTVIGVNIDGRKLFGRNELTVGIDGQFNDVKSRGFRKNILTGAESPLDSRYPNGKNNMNHIGLYGQHLYKFAGGKLILNDGIRLQSVNLKSIIADNSFFKFPFTEIEQDNLAVTGNLGVVYLPHNNLRATFGVSSGFRSPNVDDVARIFESSTATRQLIIPNPGIKPEYTYNIDFGIAQKIGDRFRFEVNGFYTFFRNAISVAPFQLNGQDSIDYNGTRVRIFANQNVNKARLYGFSTNLTADITKELQFYSTVNYTFGRQTPFGHADVPLDHIPPVFGKTSLTYNRSRVNVETYAVYNGWKRLRNFNPFGEDNQQYATPDGVPAWFTLNFKSTVNVTKCVAVQAGIENILDRNYRHFASGFSAAGRNVVLALRGNF